MKTLQETKDSPKKRGPRACLTITVILALVISALAAVLLTHPKNYAAETARPLESALAKAGGVKKCSTGDAGRGSDNKAPHYEAYFALPSGQADAITAANRVASDEGYHLTPATASDKGPLGSVDNAYIKHWLFDDSNKSSSYKDLLSGPIKLAVGVDASGAKDACGSYGQITVDSTNSVVNIQVQLPEFRR